MPVETCARVANIWLFVRALSFFKCEASSKEAALTFLRIFGMTQPEFKRPTYQGSKRTLEPLRHQGVPSVQTQSERSLMKLYFSKDSPATCEARVPLMGSALMPCISIFGMGMQLFQDVF